MNVKRSEPSRPLSTKDWVPDQPGAWALALLPALAGMVIGGFDVGRLWLTGAWLLCYCVQFTAARWLRSRFQRRYLPPVLTYAALLAVAGVPLLAMHPLILVWAPLYAVCAGVSFLGAWLRRERSLWANAAAVIATSMMAYVVYAFDAPDLLERTGMGLALAGIFMLTQFGSVLYVKTMIRERRNNRYLMASWIWHAVLLALACAIPGRTVPMMIIAAILLLRAVAMPLLGRRIRIKPVVVGMLEMVLRVAVCAYAPFCAPWISMALTF